jgi:hypothetical protein
MFREWLDLSENERLQALASKPESVRDILLAKLAEYDSMGPEERELRLRATELQYYLRPLLQVPPAERSEHLSNVPHDFRPQVAERLTQWDAVDAATRQELLQHGWAIRHFLQFESSTDAEQVALRSQLPPQRRAEFESQFARWKALPPDQRRELTRAFYQFFELPATERKRALDNLPESERRQIEVTLQAFAQLAPAQRQLCIESFRKFASLTPRQRADFLRNADRWNEMSPDDRATWRRLVTQLPPFPPVRTSRPPPPLPTSNAPPTTPSRNGAVNDRH